MRCAGAVPKNFGMSDMLVPDSVRYPILPDSVRRTLPIERKEK